MARSAQRPPALLVQVLIAVAALTGCTSAASTSAGPTPLAPTDTGTFVSAPPDSPTGAEMDPATTAPSLPDDGPLDANTVADVSGSDGLDYRITIGNAVGVVRLSPTRVEAGFPVAISGFASLQSSDFVLKPVSGVGPGVHGNDELTLSDSEAAVHAAACGDRSSIDVALEGTEPTSGCVTFTYDVSMHPGLVSLYTQGAQVNDESTVVSWNVAVAHQPRQVETGIKYTVTADGGISSVTYSTANFGQRQETQLHVTNWTVTIPSDGVSSAVLVAQNAGAGTISCRITIDGREVAHEASSGLYSVVTCSSPG